MSDEAIIVRTRGMLEISVGRFTAHVGTMGPTSVRILQDGSIPLLAELSGFDGGSRSGVVRTDKPTMMQLSQLFALVADEVERQSDDLVPP